MEVSPWACSRVWYGSWVLLASLSTRIVAQSYAGVPQVLVFSIDPCWVDLPRGTQGLFQPEDWIPSIVAWLLKLGPQPQEVIYIGSVAEQGKQWGHSYPLVTQSEQLEACLSSYTRPIGQMQSDFFSAANIKLNTRRYEARTPNQFNHVFEHNSLF